MQSTKILYGHAQNVKVGQTTVAYYLKFSGSVKTTKMSVMFIQYRVFPTSRIR